MLSIGHRGLGSDAPENTLPAVRDAADHVDAVEIDVRCCGSGELVVFHDDDLGRLTDREGLVSETDLGTLGDLTVGDSDERIPTFAEALDAWPADTGLNVDVKGATQPAAVVDAFDESAVDGQVVVSAERDALRSFDPGSVDVPVGLSVDSDPAEHVAFAAARDCDWVHVDYRLCLESDVVERSHGAGLAVDAWTVPDRATARRLADLGVDAITVDSRDAVP